MKKTNANVGKEKLDGEWVPVGQRVIIQRDEFKDKTKGGIVLPGGTQIPQLTGRIVAVSPEIAEGDDAYKYPFQIFDKVIYNPNRSVPVDFEDVLAPVSEKKNFLVPVEDVLAVFTKRDIKKE